MVPTGMKRQEDLAPGDMVIYPYLWDWQAKEGKQVGEKRRPCVVILRTETPEGTPLVALLPITTQPIKDYKTRVMVPVEERRRLGMSMYRPQSVALTDCNVERLGESSALPTFVPDRKFGERFTLDLTRRFREVFEANKAELVMRRHNSAEVTPSL